MPKKQTKDKKDLTYKPKSGWDILKGRENEIEAYNSEYLAFLSRVKTEREAVSYIEESTLACKDLHVFGNRGKAIALCRKGSSPMKDGIRLVIAHIDSPRLDLKANPLYEDTDLAMLKTHYYGGIKKYQWLARPLAIHGVVVREDATNVKIVIGEEEDEPCFTIEDLLPHLAGKAQYSKKIEDAFQAEKLNIIFGSRPDLKAKEDKVKG
ncbi:MAG TPA: aminopeptidase, partial [Deltaproteobacteria bacterium]|nr:aminopeptidase [Deltaproteobacteria bacterium]